MINLITTLYVIFKAVDHIQFIISKLYFLYSKCLYFHEINKDNTLLHTQELWFLNFISYFAFLNVCGKKVYGKNEK